MMVIAGRWAKAPKFVRLAILIQVAEYQKEKRQKNIRQAVGR